MSVKNSVLDVLRNAFGNATFTIRSGIARGYKRRFGLGFVPKWGESAEDIFLRGKQFTGQTIFDIGAYVGLYSIFFSSKAGPTGKVYSFEPNPMNYHELTFNLKLNGFHATKTLQMAVSDKPGKMEMVVDPHLTSRGSLDTEWVAQAGKNAKRIPVDVVTIDQLMENGTLTKPDFVKIDVEALEIPVLRGMKKTLEKYRPVLWVEVHGPLTKELIETISPYGYDITHFELGKKVSPEHVPHVLHGHLYCVAT